MTRDKVQVSSGRGLVRFSLAPKEQNTESGGRGIHRKKVSSYQYNNHNFSDLPETIIITLCLIALTALPNSLCLSAKVICFAGGLSYSISDGWPYQPWKCELRHVFQTGCYLVKSWLCTLQWPQPTRLIDL